jgi:hypothetical protein
MTKRMRGMQLLTLPLELKAATERKIRGQRKRKRVRRGTVTTRMVIRQWR